MFSVYAISPDVMGFALRLPDVHSRALLHLSDQSSSADFYATLASHSNPYVLVSSKPNIHLNIFQTALILT